jgi:hypothetical protein
MSTIPGSTLFVIELATGPLLDPDELLPAPLPNEPPLKLNEQPLLPQLPLKPRPCAGLPLKPRPVVSWASCWTR